MFALGLAALFAVLLFLSDGDILLTRPLWVDEWLTVLPATRASPFDLIGDLAAGADGGATLLHLVVWGMRNVLGELSPTTLRVMSLVCVFTALCLLYVVLRRRFGANASIAGALARALWFVVALASLALMPIALMLVSVAGQPSMCRDTRLPRRSRGAR